MRGLWKECAMKLSFIRLVKEHTPFSFSSSSLIVPCIGSGVSRKRQDCGKNATI